MTPGRRTAATTGSQPLSGPGSSPRGKAAPGTDNPGSGDSPPGLNEVRLSGRVAADAQNRVLPSGDHLVQLRVIVAWGPANRRPRSAEPAGSFRVATVDTIDLVCWTDETRQAAGRLVPGEHVEVEGALRRRFFGGPGGRQSRYEVEVGAIRRLSEPVSADT